MRVIMRMAVALTSLVATMTALLTAVHCIPNECLYDNVRLSVQAIRDEGIYRKVHGIPFYKLDTYSDCIMLNTVLCADNGKPYQSAMLNLRHVSLGSGERVLATTEETVKHHGKGLSTSSYGRYWHGYLLLLRPALLVFDYSGIRIINTMLLTLMAAVILLLLYRRVSKAAALTLLVSLLFANLHVIAQAMQFSISFYIAFASMIAVLMNPRRMSGDDFLMLIFITGCLTSFFELLCTPLITLGLPLTAYVIAAKPEKPCRQVILSCLSWLSGYGSMWMSKWALATATTGFNAFRSAAEAAAERTSRASMDMFVHKMLGEGISFTQLLLIAAIASIVLLAAWTLYLRITNRLASWKDLKGSSALLLIALTVPAWYIALQNHSVWHCLCTWRIMMIALWCVLMYLCAMIKTNKGNMLSILNNSAAR